MWVTTLNIVTLGVLLAALAYVARGTRKLDASLDALVAQQSERRRRMERDLERVSQSVAEMERAET
jgi:hypothetical protein